MPKNDKWICRCGAKFSTRGQLEAHILKRKIREDAGWEKKDMHDYAMLVRNGTVIIEEQ